MVSCWRFLPGHHPQKAGVGSKDKKASWCSHTWPTIQDAFVQFRNLGTGFATASVSIHLSIDEGECRRPVQVSQIY